MKIIIYLTRNKIEIYDVRGSLVEKLGEAGYTQDEFPKLLGQLKLDMGLKRVRVLVADSLSYVVTIQVPKTSLENERKYISQEVAKKIPEKFNDYDWDFVNVHYRPGEKKKKKGQMVLVFAPVKAIWESLAKAAKEVGLEIEAVEPVVWAKNRNANPVIGLSMKKDIKGDDKKVLNLDFKAVKATQSSETEVKRAKESKVVIKKYLIILLVVAVISAIVTGGILVSRKALNSDKLPDVSSQEKEVVEVREASPAAEILEEEEEVDLADYSVQVLNGSGVGGAAGYVAQLLESKGFEDIKSGNADDSNFDLTKVQMRDFVETQVYEVIEGVLGEEYEVTRSAVLLAELSDYDVVITVGKRI